MNYSTAIVLVGDTLQSMALRELGDVARWTDLVYLNNLRPPYIVGSQAEADANPGTVWYGQIIKVPQLTNIPLAVSNDSDLFGIDVLLEDSLLTIVDGDISTITGRPNLKQALVHRLETFLTDLIRHPTYGCNINVVFGQKNTAIVKLLAEGFVRRALNAEPRVKRVLQLNAKNQGDVLAISASVLSIIDNIPVDINLVFPITG